MPRKPQNNVAHALLDWNRLGDCIVARPGGGWNEYTKPTAAAQPAQTKKNESKNTH
jgi:hypothetical protein